MTKLRFTLFIATTVASLHAGVILDNFNRPDASTLGPNWTQQAGTDQIVSNQATGSSGSLATYNGFSSNTAFVSAFVNGTSTQYIALVLDFADANDNMFIKIQDNSGTAFTNYAFYYGNNGSNGGVGGSTFQSLSSTFSSALIWASVSGNTATLFIDPSFTGVAQQTYSFTYNANPGGTGGGLGFYGTASADDFGTGTPSSTTPEPGTFALLSSALAGVVILGKRLSKQ